MLMGGRSRPIVVLAVLIVVATAAFGIGAALEKSDSHDGSSESASLNGSASTTARGGWR
jgi:hypothetical protein